MPRTNSRKRNNHRNVTALRLPTDSNLSANAPEFVPLSQHNIVNNDNIANQRDNSAVQPMALDGCSSEPNSSGNDNNSEATKSICALPNSNANKGQRDLLINLLNNSKVDCVICYELAKNVEPIWNCRNCFQIMHLKCVMVWFIKSHRNASWRCPACQNEVYGKPNYLCFCGSLPNPFANNVDTPHSCGQVCGLQKKNAHEDYDDCHHKCTLLCHPGPCPRCVVQVLRKCACGKTKSYAQCGQSSPIVCQNICSKILKCNNHVCEKQCHGNECGPCKEHCEQDDSGDEHALRREELMAEMLAVSRRIPSNSRTSPYQPPRTSALVSEEELRMLGLNPEELLNRTDEENYDLNEEMFIGANDDDDDEDDDDDDDDDDTGLHDDEDDDDEDDDDDDDDDDDNDHDNDHDFDENDIDDVDDVDLIGDINDEMNEIFWRGTHMRGQPNMPFTPFPFATVFSINGFRSNMPEDTYPNSNNSNTDNEQPDGSRDGSGSQISVSRDGLFLMDNVSDVNVDDNSVPSTSSSSSPSSNSSSILSTPSSPSSLSSPNLSNDTSDDNDNENGIDSPMESEASNSSWNTNLEINQSDDESHQSHGYSEDSPSSSHHSNINGMDDSNDSYGGFEFSKYTE